MLPKKIDDWHWAWGKYGFGFQTHGKCWKIFSYPEKRNYGNGVTWFCWWRFFLSVER